MSNDDIKNMTVSEYQERFGKDPMEIISGLDFKSEQEIESALREHANSVTAAMEASTAALNVAHETIQDAVTNH